MSENRTKDSIPAVVVIRLLGWNTITENIRLMLSKQSISEKKKNRNLKPPYSTLNLDTNSLSPSARSKGVRLSSISHRIISGGVRRS